MKHTELKPRLSAILGPHKTIARATKALQLKDKSALYHIMRGRNQSGIPGPIKAAIEAIEACPEKLRPDAWKAR